MHSVSLACLSITAAACVAVAHGQSPAARPLKPDETLSDAPGLQVYESPKGRTFDNGRFYVYVPSSYSPSNPMPLVVSAHGAGCTGADEIKAWTPYADQYRFIAVCPSYAITDRQPGVPVPHSEMQARVKACKEFERDVMRRVCGSLNVDRRFVLQTGFSGGGNPVWCAMSFPEFFTALCLRSANFSGPDVYDFRNLAAWRKRPIYVFWGTADAPGIAGERGQGAAGLDFLRKTVRAQTLKHEVIEGGRHDSRIDLAARWFAEDVVATALAATNAPRRTLPQNR
jgi:poly(3-hydroxybutyrate) depolymerase